MSWTELELGPLISFMQCALQAPNQPTWAFKSESSPSRTYVSSACLIFSPILFSLPLTYAHRTTQILQHLIPYPLYWDLTSLHTVLAYCDLTGNGFNNFIWEQSRKVLYYYYPSCCCTVICTWLASKCRQYTYVRAELAWESSLLY